MLRLISSRRTLQSCRALSENGLASGFRSATTTSTATSLPPRDNFEVVMAGGGLMGCSSAYFLAKRMDPAQICVVERDLSYDAASTPRSVGGVRHQFSNKENVLMSMFCMDFLKTMHRDLHVPGQDPPDAQFCGDGYLLLASEAGVDTLRENFAVQQECNAATVLLSKAELKEQFPWIDNSDIELACHGVRNEGWIDPWSLLRAFRAKAQSMGVVFVSGDVTAVECDGQAVASVDVKPSNSDDSLSLRCNYLVNSAGPQAANIATMAGIGAPENVKCRDRAALSPLLATALPVAPRRRCVFAVEQTDGPVTNCPLVVDTSGAYFRREGTGGMFLVGKCPSPEDDHDNLDLEVDYDFFDNTIWPRIANRAPVFEGLKMKSAWAGYYEYNVFDQNGIIGRHPVISNFIFTNGFSGHGLQHGAAAGRAVSEIVCDGDSHSIDLRRLGFQRILDGVPCLEKNVI